MIQLSGQIVHKTPKTQKLAQNRQKGQYQCEEETERTSHLCAISGMPNGMRLLPIKNIKLMLEKVPKC